MLGILVLVISLKLILHWYIIERLLIFSEDENVDDKELAPRRKKSSRTGVAVVDPSEASSTSDMLTSAAIFSAVLVAGTFVVSKFK